MGQILDFRRQPRATAPRRRRRGASKSQNYVGFIAFGMLIAFGAVHQSEALGALVRSRIAPLLPDNGAATQSARYFPICRGVGVNCVVDGDTFYLDGVKIRVANIDAPEVSEPRCAREMRLGAEATRRFQALLNAGPIELRSIDRDEDVYGRKLRTVHRNGRSLGAMLVAEGFAHDWIGHKQSWCT